jgi:hypothetical protein
MNLHICIYGMFACICSRKCVCVYIYICIGVYIFIYKYIHYMIVDVCNQSLKILKTHAWRAADVDIQFEMIRQIERAISILKYNGNSNQPYLEDLIEARRYMKIRRG